MNVRKMLTLKSLTKRLLFFTRKSSHTLI